MRLFGKYAFDRLRDCLQGIFEYQELKSDTGMIYMLELWQIRLVITPHVSVEFFINSGEQKGYVSLGKVELQ